MIRCQVLQKNYILQRIKIEGETLFGKNDLEFRAGLSIITGAPGTGKSTIINLIYWLKNPDDITSLLPFFDYSSIKYFLKLEDLEERKNITFVFDADIDLNQQVKLITTIPDNYDSISKQIKILLVNEESIADYLFNNEEMYETRSFGEKVTHVILDLTNGVENCIILLDDVFMPLDVERRYLLFNHLVQLSESNQVFLTLQTQQFQELRNILVHREPERLDYLRQAHIINLKGFYQTSIIDYFKEEPVSDYLEEFHQGIINIRKIIALRITDQEIKKSLNRILYANIITVMETYLSECFTRLVIGNESYKLKLLESSPDFNKETFNLRDAYDWLGEIDANIIGKIQGIVFHNIDKVISMYKNILGIEFLDMGEIARAINKRHDIVHRNGKTKDGKVLEFNEKDILKLASYIQKLIEHIEKQVKSL